MGSSGSGATAAAISDTAYNATTWNAVTSVAASKNAIRDEIESLASTYVTQDGIDARLYGVTATTGTDTLVDATTAMQAAGDAALAAKKPLILPPGNIYIAGALSFAGVLDIDGQFTSEGYRPTDTAWGGGTVLIAGTGSNLPVITLDAAGSIKGPRWRNFLILGSTNYNGGSDYAPRPAVKWVDVASQFFVENVYISGFLRQAWLLQGVQDGMWLNPRVYYCGTDGTYPAWDFQDGSIVTNCNAIRVIGGDTEKCPYSLKADGATRHITFHDHKIELGPGINPANSPIDIEATVGEFGFKGGQFTCNNAADVGEYAGGAATAPYMFRIKNNRTKIEGGYFASPSVVGGGGVSVIGSKWINHDGAGIDIDDCIFDMPPSAFGIVVGSRAQLGSRNRYRGYPTGGLSLNFIQAGLNTVIRGGEFENRDSSNTATGGTMVSCAGANVRVYEPKIIGLFDAAYAYIGGASAASCIYRVDGRDYVDLTTAQTVAGVKTFSSSPIAPTQTAADNSTKLATTAYADAGVATLLPWHVMVNAVTTPAANTNWSTYSQQGGDYLAGRIASSNAQNDSVSYDVVLGAGTWTLVLLHTAGSARGIYTFTIGGVSPTSLSGSVDTIDGYAASTTTTRSTITGIVIPTSAKYRIALTMATKNGSSSNYTGTISGLLFTRTA